MSKKAVFKAPGSRFLTIHVEEQNSEGGGTGQNQNWFLEKPSFSRLKPVFSDFFAKMIKNIKKSYFMRKIPRNTCFSNNSTPWPPTQLFFRPLEGGGGNPSQTLPSTNPSHPHKPMYVPDQLTRPTPWNSMFLNYLDLSVSLYRCHYTGFVKQNFHQ